MHEELVDAKALDIHRATSSRLHDLCVLGVAGFVAVLLVKILLGEKITWFATRGDERYACICFKVAAINEY